MNRAARMARLSVLSNALLIAMKLAVGILGGSVSIISEAIHSFMDLAAAIMAFFSIRIARRPADTVHPYGHEKVENVSGVIESALIFAAAVFIIVEAVRRVLHPQPVERLELGVAVMAVSGIVNAVVSRILSRVARQERSVALEADAVHLRTDVYSSAGVAGGLLLIVVLGRTWHLGWAYYLDPAVAIGISAVILVEAVRMLRTAFAPLLDTSISAEELAVVESSVARHPEAALHSMRTRRAGGTTHIDFHLTVPAGMSVQESHDLCDAIERDLEQRLSNTSVLIHIEPRPAG
ncbi:MAG TPA: cation diffusion facilitator family transporter [Spirochaetia bacterium]|nr:cation diffusion facilitator family transporter [Spirochaetia bacterium]